MIDFATQRYALTALASAALFGVSTPLAKLLVGQVPPQLLAGLLYLGSGTGLLVLWLVSRAGKARRETLPTRQEIGGWGWLAGAVVSGGVLAPVLLLWGVIAMAASGASLLLNAEAVLTILVAALLFGEHVSGRVWAAAAVMLAGASTLLYEPGTTVPVSLRALAVVGACFFWALDNNFTRNISSGDPVLIAMVKGLIAGTVNCALAMAAGASLPSPGMLSGSLALGAASYGASLVLYIVALRHLGSARTGAHFATSPFIGAVVAIALLGESTGTAFIASFALMLAATWLLVTEKHLHQHTHERLDHSHPHLHDEHHQHAHAAGEETGPHTHAHAHEPLTHSHPHLPDLHHRHRH